LPAFYIFALSKKTNQTMKKIILLAALALPLFATAQSNFKFGINTGRNFSGIRDTGENDYDNWFGYVAGLSAEVPLSSRFALNANLNYEAKSFRSDYYNNYNFDPVYTYDEVRATTTLHYLTLPVNVKFFVSPDSNTIYILGGGYAAYKIGARFRPDDNDSTRLTNVSKTDFGATLGAGYRLGLDEDNELNFELRDNLGLTSTLKGGDGYKLNAISVVVNWQFKL
jgi:Outer membrane protein beta-barrel domain